MHTCSLLHNRNFPTFIYSYIICDTIDQKDESSLNEAFRRFLRSDDLLAKATKSHVTDAYINYAQVRASRITIVLYHDIADLCEAARKSIRKHQEEISIMHV